MHFEETKRNGTLTMLHTLHAFCDDLEKQKKQTADTLTIYSSIYFRRRSRRKANKARFADDTTTCGDIHGCPDPSR